MPGVWDRQDKRENVQIERQRLIHHWQRTYVLSKHLLHPLRLDDCIHQRNLLSSIVNMKQCYNRPIVLAKL
jgi:hypothetical protein